MNKPILPDDDIKEDSDPVRGMGDNNPPAFDQAVLDDVVRNFDDFMLASKVWLKLPVIETKEQAEKATDMIAGLRKLHKLINDARVAQKKPHDDAGTKVQKAFTPYLVKVKEAADQLKPRLAKFLAAEAAKAEEERRKAAAIAAEAERKAAEELAAALSDNDVSAQIDAEQAIKDAAKEAARAAKPVKASAKSATSGGRTVSLKTIRTAVVENDMQVFMHYRKHPDVIALLTRLATADVRASDVDEAKIPGISIKETKSAA